MLTYFSYDNGKQRGWWGETMARGWYVSNKLLLLIFAVAVVIFGLFLYECSY
ncbi:MAG: hypothetical protein ACE3JN_13320 [Ectobacillus sp.]